MPRPSLHVVPTGREVILGCFTHAAALVLPVPTLVRAWLVAFAPLDQPPPARRRTIEGCWETLEELEELCALWRRAVGWHRVPPGDLELCPPSDPDDRRTRELKEDGDAVALAAVAFRKPLHAIVFGEVELLLSLDQARKELGESPRASTPAEEARPPAAALSTARRLTSRDCFADEDPEVTEEPRAPIARAA